MRERASTELVSAAPRAHSVARAVASVALATLLTLLLWPLNAKIPFAFFYLATLHVTERAGRGAGLLTAALSMLLVTYVVLPPRFSFDVGHERWFDTGMFVLVAAAMVAIAERLRARAREVRRKERRISALVHGAMDAIVIADAEQRIVSFNEAAERIFGYRAEEVVNGPIARLFPPALAIDAMPRREGADSSHPRESIGMRASGESFPLELTASRCADDGQGHFSIVIVRDVSEQRRARRELERERKFSSDLLECMPGILYLYDTSGRFLRFNKDFEVASGYASEEIMRMHPLDFFRESDRPLLSARIAEVFEKGQATVEAPFRSKDGTLTPYLFTGRQAMVDGIDCLVGVGIDISDRMVAESALVQSEERYRTTLDSIFESCQLIGFDWRFLYLNPAAVVQNRRPLEEMLGRRVQDVFPGIEQTEAYELLARVMRDRTTEHAEIEFKFPEGQSAWFDVRVRPAPEGVFVFCIDISERIAVERERAEMLAQQREANAQLETTVAVRTADLRRALAQAESADRTKSAFLATMSHELRTPLNAIIGFTLMLRRGQSGPLTDEQARQLGMVEHSAHHLLALINDVLDISRIEADQFEVHAEPFDVRAAVERVVSLIRPLADKQGLKLEVSMAPDVDGMFSDRRRVEQVLINLLSNAVKFTERGSVFLTVSMAASRGEGAPDLVRIEVRDTGIGIRESDLPKIFQPFKQLDSGLGRHHEGTGLGLAICRRLATMLGGDVTVASTVGVGSTFTLTLPLFSACEGVVDDQAVA
ncbi:MAG: PAS domain S-box protein [Polyangiales bacterium]